MNEELTPSQRANAAEAESIGLRKEVAALTLALAEIRGREDKKGKALKAVYRWLLSAEKLLKDADISGINAVILLCHGITADTAKPCQDCLGPGVPICATCGQCPEHCPDSPQASAKRCGTPGCSGRGHADSAWPTPPQQEMPTKEEYNREELRQERLVIGEPQPPQKGPRP